MCGFTNPTYHHECSRVESRLQRGLHGTWAPELLCERAVDVGGLLLSCVCLPAVVQAAPCAAGAAVESSLTSWPFECSLKWQSGSTQWVGWLALASCALLLQSRVDSGGGGRVCLKKCEQFPGCEGSPCMAECACWWYQAFDDVC